MELMTRTGIKVLTMPTGDLTHRVLKEGYDEGLPETDGGWLCCLASPIRSSLPSEGRLVLSQLTKFPMIES